MAVFNSDNFTASEGTSLATEFGLVGNVQTPLLSYLLGKNQVTKATGRIHSWIEKTFDDNLAGVSARPEGEDPLQTFTSGRKEYSNVEEVFSKSTAISGTASAISPTEFAEEINMRMLELKYAINRKLISGVRNDGSNGSPRAMQGLVNWATPANTTTVTAVTEDAIRAAMKRIYDAGQGFGTYVAVVNVETKNAIDQLFKEDFSYVKNVTDGLMPQVFGLVVSQYQSNMGTLNFIVDQAVAANEVIITNADMLRVAFLRAPFYKDLAITGDVEKKGMVGAEVTLEVLAPAAVARIVIDAE